MKILLAYVPVLHRGYLEFFQRHQDADLLVLFDATVVETFEWLKKDLRSLDPPHVLHAIKSWNCFPEVKLLGEVPESIFQAARAIVMPDETECHSLAETMLVGLPVYFESVNLRYDKKKTESTAEIGAEEISWPEAIYFMNMAEGLRTRSYDWWIQVGAMFVKDGNVLLVAWNEHKPSDREALYMGDPRSNYRRGLNIELSLADHAESILIGEAARAGISLNGSDLYVTTFPCPPCSRLIRRSGVNRLFFRRGYSVLDGDKMLRESGIELYRVQ